MPWYRIHARFGPGHQSKGFGYFWVGHRLDRAAKQMYFDDEYRDRDWPIGGVRLVRKLPKRVIEQKVRNCQTAIRYHQHMLKVLAKTPVRRTADAEEVEEHRGQIQMAKLMREAQDRMRKG